MESQSAESPYVYLLKSDKGRIYVGDTADLRRRISEHNQRKVYYTRRHDQWSLIYYEAYLDEQSAKIRERKFKQYGSAYHGLLKRINER